VAHRIKRVSAAIVTNLTYRQISLAGNMYSLAEQIDNPFN